MADTDNNRFGQKPISGFHDEEHHTESCRSLDNPISEGLEGRERSDNMEVHRTKKQVRPASTSDSLQWLECPDGKTRPVKPGIRLLAHAVPNRVGKLRGFGNAIVPTLAAEFIQIALECLP
jgi:DNA (cytosine-5)-methyltransferase 1